MSSPSTATFGPEESDMLWEAVVMWKTASIITELLSLR